ncbi:MAG: o-succinylbenzoate synthase [Bacteroidales bacterium]|nr:o-succinylbenzoate synthase [Bacteroidales bacterium]
MIKAWYRKKVLSFLRPAGTSRGILHNKPSWYIFLSDDRDAGISGVGECSIIPGLSMETEEMTDRKISEVCRIINREGPDGIPPLPDFPSIASGLEMARLDLKNGGKRVLFPADFTAGLSGIRINGLIWMGTAKYLVEQVEEKLLQGFTCLKFKIGSLHTEKELLLLKSIRKRFNAGALELRVDANGAFEPRFAMEVLKKLADLEVHSIEQPIKPGQYEEMAKLCMNSPVPVALDEELLWKPAAEEKKAMISHIRPQYLVLKPGLLGGIKQAEEYIILAKKAGTGWWITSALESNIGLNAIAQWTYTLGDKRAQGLGTGKLYRHNIDSPLVTEGENLFYRASLGWDLSFIT